MEVVITGASGYIGQHLTAELIKRGARVRAVVRPGANAADVAVLKDLGADIFEGELVADTKDGQIESAFKGADRAVHLIGSVAPPKDGPGVEELHRSYTASFAQACADAGIKHSLLVTALGADEKSESLYLSSKKHAETNFAQCLQAAGLRATVVRPSLIVGRLVGQRDSKLVDRYRMLLNTRPVVPLIGGGKNLLEPVFVGDLACALAALLEDKTADATEQNQPGNCRNWWSRKTQYETVCRSLRSELVYFQTDNGCAFWCGDNGRRYI